MERGNTMNNNNNNNNSVCINDTTFDIMKMENCFMVDYKLGKTISILNKKGYYTELCSKAKIYNPFMLADTIYNLAEEKILEINDNTKEKLKKVITLFDNESTIIMFKEPYSFVNLPAGFKIAENKLYYNLRILKDSSDIEFKSLMELDKENTTSLENLEKWAEKLPVNT